MTLMAGMWARRPDATIPDAAREELERALSRHPGDEVTVFRDRRVCLLKVDIGAFGSPGYHVDAGGSVSMLTGEPLLQRDGEPAAGSRARDLEVLHRGFADRDYGPLRDTHGAFSAVHYDPRSGALTLITDKLGLRPLYYWIGESHIVFASALRILEAVRAVPKVMDLRAVTEIVAFGYELENRTPYQGVLSLRPAEILHGTDGTSPQRYWRWDEFEASDRPEAELMQNVHEQFVKAVARRQREDRTTMALLSGGLDSRVVVAALRALDARVHTLNFSYPKSQDHVFAADFAEKIGTLHHEGDVDIGQPDFFGVVQDVWHNSENRRQWPAERPMLVWTGNDGDVSLGHLWMSTDVVSLLRQDKLDEAVAHFLREQKKHVLHRLLHREVREALSGTLQAGMRAELAAMRSRDPGRNLYVFLMINNMRKHLMRHMENVDRYRLELQVPFCDSAFIVSVMAVPLDLCLYHRFYTRWLALFQPAVTQVPWQTYPGREPCPLPIPEGLAYQWNPKHFAPRYAAERKSLLRRSTELIHPQRFPRRIVSGTHFGLAWLACRLGLADYSYVLEAALTYHRYWTRAGGKFALAPAAAAPRPS